MERWLYSTNCKDIAILYMIFAIFAGLIGTGLSIIIRLELAGPNPQILHNNGQLFNSIVSLHAVAMLFFLVMPMTVGFFGKKIKYLIIYIYYIKYLVNKNILLKSSHSDSGDIIPLKEESCYNSNLTKLNYNLGPYLAGLIEGDGTFAVHLNTSKAKKYNPSIYIVFKRSDKILAEYLCKLTKCGKVYDKVDRGYVIWSIQRIVDVYNIIILINGYMRTPKYETFKLVVNWLNNYYINNKDNKSIIIQNIINSINIINCKSIDKSPLNSNGWLTGFTDADGNFSISLSNKTKKHNSRVNLSYRLEIRQNYLNNLPDFDNSCVKTDNQSEMKLYGKLSFYPIMMDISNLFDVNLYSRERKSTFNNKEGIYQSYIVAVTSYKNLPLVKEYFDRFPLLTSKYLDYLDWCKVLEKILNEGQNTLPGGSWELSNNIRKDFNKSRKTFTWEHLDKNLYKHI